MFTNVKQNDRIYFDIPYKPDLIYKNRGWVSYGDWIGTGRVANTRKQFLPFNKAREFVRNLNLKNQNDWRKFTKSDEFPHFIPTAPEQIYKNLGWISFGNWIGSNYVASQNRSYLEFEKARSYVRRLKLKSYEEWKLYCQSGKKPDFIPTAVHRIYKNNGWKGINDWLGTGIDPRYVEFRPFLKARKFVHELGIKNVALWREYCKSGKKPTDIPADPDKWYKNKGWIGYGDWLGTGHIAPFLAVYRDYESAKKYISKFCLKSEADWRKFSKSRLRPKDIPVAVHSVYKNKGWKGYGDFLGTGRRQTVSFADAKNIVKKLKLKSFSHWKHYCKSGKMDKRLPVAADTVYKKSGWKGWPDFLGNANG